jgi:hypothetical protein
MRIKQIWAVNFRGLLDIRVNDTQDLNVIVGPNAVGKSTLLDAIRLPKAILAPRFPNEAQQTLINIGALSPHYQVTGGSAIDIGSLANDARSPIRLGFCVELSGSDVTQIRNSIVQIATALLQGQMANTGNDGSLALTQFLSNSAGQHRLSEIAKEISPRIATFTQGVTLEVELTMDANVGNILGKNVLDQTIVAFLERSLPPNRAIFNMFPADRVLPQGEQAIQIGTADTQQQLLSYIANPSLKYARVKQITLQSIIFGGNNITKISEEVELILSNLLPGKTLAGVHINPIGMLKVLIKDVNSGNIFDIDYMSSGEKGLLMTFLFIRLTMVPGSIVLVDEPELHLNAAVQERLVRFIVNIPRQSRGL